MPMVKLFFLILPLVLRYRYIFSLGNFTICYFINSTPLKKYRPIVAYLLVCMATTDLKVFFLYNPDIRENSLEYQKSLLK